MKFIFPQNYDFSTKLFGLIDYSIAILNVVWSGIVFILINIIFNSLNIKIFLFIIFSFPVLLFSIIGINRWKCDICNELFNKISYKTKIIFLWKEELKYKKVTNWNIYSKKQEKNKLQKANKSNIMQPRIISWGNKNETRTKWKKNVI